MIIYRCGKYFLFFHRGRIQAVCCLCRTIWSRWEFWTRRVWGASGQTCHGSSCMPLMMTRSATAFRPILWCWGTWPFKQLTHLWDTPSTRPRPSTYAAYDRHLPQLSFVSPHSSWGQHTHWCYQHMNFIQSGVFAFCRVQWVILLNVWSIWNCYCCSDIWLLKECMNLWTSAEWRKWDLLRRSAKFSPHNKTVNLFRHSPDLLFSQQWTSGCPWLNFISHWANDFL